MENEEYKKKTRLKNKYAEENKDRFVFLTWYPQTESVDVLINRLIVCIEDIRKSAYV